jgi:hypothetical protein
VGRDRLSCGLPIIEFAKRLPVCILRMAVRGIFNNGAHSRLTVIDCKIAHRVTKPTSFVVSGAHCPSEPREHRPLRRGGAVGAGASVSWTTLRLRFIRPGDCGYNEWETRKVASREKIKFGHCSMKSMASSNLGATRKVELNAVFIPRLRHLNLWR